MIMKKLFVVLLMLCSFVANAQKFQPAKLVFTNGKSITGLAKAPTAADKYIIMKRDEKAPKEKISSDELTKIILTEEGSEPLEYVREYSAINGKKSANPLWMQVIVSGPATLYGLGSAMMTTRGGSFGHERDFQH